MSTHEKVVQLLTSDAWDRRKRNAAAKQFAINRSDGGDDVIRTSYRITNHETVGRYDRLRAQLLRVVAEASGCAAHIKSEPYRYQGRRRRYRVILFGYRGDVEQSVAIYEGLMTVANQQLVGIAGEGVAQKRRAWFSGFMMKLRERLADVGTAQNMAWVGDHYARAKAALDNSPARWDRELV